MLAQIRLDERAHGNDAQAFGAGGVQSRFDQGIAEMPAADRRRLAAAAGLLDGLAADVRERNRAV